MPFVLGQQEILFGNDAQREALEAIEIKQAVLLRERHGLQERGARILAVEREQSAHRERATPGAPLFECRDIRGDWRIGLRQDALLGQRLGAGPLSAWWSMLG